MNVVVIVPTYNEAENIGKMIDILGIEFSKITNHNCMLLVVDGNSPDGTAHIVKSESQNNPFVHLLLEEKKGGLGAAYIYAFKHAINNLRADVIIEMDADFQHSPSDVSRMIKEIDNGYDYVIGSRFLNGGSIPKDWALYRKFLSIGGNYFSKIVLGIFSVNDFTSGFKASRVSGFVDKIDLDSIMSKGFAYKIDLLYKMFKLGAKIKEIPIEFGMRDRGDSKMEKNNFMDSLTMVLRLRYEENKRFFKFCIVGFTGLFVDLTLSNIFRFILPNPSVAASSAALIAMLVTFILNNMWSFSDKKITQMKELIYKFVSYVAISLVPIVVRFFVVDLIVNKYSETFIIYNFAVFISIIFGLIWNFTFYSKIIWRRKK
jgi:dolichol-phosphate mannosyltransferase